MSAASTVCFRTRLVPLSRAPSVNIHPPPHSHHLVQKKKKSISWTQGRSTQFLRDYQAEFMFDEGNDDDEEEEEDASAMKEDEEE